MQGFGELRLLQRYQFKNTAFKKISIVPGSESLRTNVGAQEVEHFYIGTHNSQLFIINMYIINLRMPVKTLLEGPCAVRDVYIFLCRISVGGAHCTYFMQRLMQLKQPHFQNSITLSRAQVRTVTIVMCFCSTCVVIGISGAPHLYGFRLFRGTVEME